MIELVVACMFAAQPLAATSHQGGMWFIGDRAPGMPQAQHALCARVSEGEYMELLQLLHRPVVLAVDDDTLWFVDDGQGIELYSVRIQLDPDVEDSAIQISGRASLQSFLETDERTTDMIILDGKPVVACGGDALYLYEFDGANWITKPSLALPNAHIARLQDRIIAAAPHESGITMWHLHQGQWQGGDLIEVQGRLVDLVVREDWPLLVVVHSKTVQVIGLHHNGPVELASLDLLKGRWGILPSTSGLTALSVQRNGKTTAIDIGWPSGMVAEPVVLTQRLAKVNPFETILSFLLPLAALIMIVLLIRRSSQKAAK